MKFIPLHHQPKAAKFLIDNPYAAMWAEMGTGKTAVTLTALKWLIQHYCTAYALVVSTPRIIKTVWPDEIDKWDHLSCLTYAVCHGTVQKRLDVLQQRLPDVTTVSVNNFNWLVGLFHKNPEKWPFDTIIFDESSLFKNPSSIRFRTAKWVKDNYPVDRIYELTATPRPNSIMDIWPQMYLLDGGKRLGTAHTRFKKEFFFEQSYKTSEEHTGYKPRMVIPKFGTMDYVQQRIKDLIMVIKQDPNDKREVRHNPIHLEFDTTLAKSYRRLQKEAILELEGAESRMDSVSIATKLLQFCSGDIYTPDTHQPDEKLVKRVHNLKLDALQELRDGINQPLLVAYLYRSALDRLKDLPGAVVLDQDPETIRNWNAGNIELLLCHPASAGHGLNLQHGGHHICWYGIPWSLELHQQLIGRLNRTGQQHQVYNHEILFKDSIEMRVAEALKQKDTDQARMVDSIPNLIVAGKK